MVNNKINVNVIDGLQPILDRIIDYDNITNCITEIPQDIKLELVDGVLTLKVGSKVYVPNGAGKFDEVVISGDKTVTGFTTGADNVQFLLFINSINQSPYCFRVQDCYSGSTAPTATVGNMMWYDTSNNIIRNSADQGSTWGNIWGLPLAVVTASNKVVTSIDQVFNGFGYIGLKNYMLPGVKFLIAQGYNLDGTYKNQEYVIDKVIVSNNDINNNAITFFRKYPSNKHLQIYNITTNHYLGELSSVPAVGSAFQWYYNTTERMWYMHEAGATAWIQADYINLGWCTTNSTHFKGVFKAVDQNDFNKLDEEVATLDAQNVKLTGNQTIGGSKTFTGVNTYTGAARLRHLNDDSTKAPAEQIYYQWGMEDKNGVWLGGFEGNHLTDGSYTKGMYAKQQGGAAYAQIIVGIRPDGSTFTSAPTPATNDNAASIATTAWFRNNMQVVDSKPSSPTTGVFYFIKE